jgi:hypothetical protein
MFMRCERGQRPHEMRFRLEINTKKDQKISEEKREENDS